MATSPGRVTTFRLTERRYPDLDVMILNGMGIVRAEAPKEILHAVTGH